MPIRQYLGSDASFGPEDLTAMGTAFSEARRILGLNDLTEPHVELLGRMIVRAALEGERDPARLCARAVRSYRAAKAS